MGFSLSLCDLGKKKLWGYFNLFFRFSLFGLGKTIMMLFFRKETGNWRGVGFDGVFWVLGA